MTKRISLFAVALAVAASFAAPAVADVPPVCRTHTPLAQCLKELLSSDSEICVPTGDLEDDCRIGG